MNQYIFFPFQKLAEDLNNSNTNNANLDHVKKMYARQRAKDLAEHAKSVMSKEKELEDLRKQLSLQQSGQHLPVGICIKLYFTSDCFSPRTEVEWCNQKHRVI